MSALAESPSCPSSTTSGASTDSTRSRANRWPILFVERSLAPMTPRMKLHFGVFVACHDGFFRATVANLSRVTSHHLPALYLPTNTSELVRGLSTYEYDLGSLCRGVLKGIAMGGYAMMPPHAPATAVPGHHQRVRAATATAGQRPGQGRRHPCVTP